VLGGGFGKLVIPIVVIPSQAAQNEDVGKNAQHPSAPPKEERTMYYLYGSKPGVPQKLVATFGSEQQLLAYVRWATLSEQDGRSKFEQKSALAGYEAWSHAPEPQTNDDTTAVVHNPSPSML